MKAESGLREPLNEAEKAAKNYFIENPQALNASPSAMGHFALARQASTWMRGPMDNELEVQLLDFEDAIGKDVGTSPWHVVSRRRYDLPQAVTVWGVSLTDAYRFVVDGDRFEGLDRFVVNRLPVSIPWNLVALDDGRVIIPDQDGFGGERLFKKQSREPSFLFLQDDPAQSGKLDQGISLERLVVMNTADVANLCHLDESKMLKRYSFTELTPTYTGEWGVSVVFEEEGVKRTYLVILDGRFEPIAAVFIDKGISTNARAVERLDKNRSAFYVATEQAMIKATWDRAGGKLIRSWKRELNIRRRTGTTPTLVNTESGDKFVILVETKAAVISLMNGLIIADVDDSPSILVAVRREDHLSKDQPEVIKANLPDWLKTVENSPAAFGQTIVIANYSGYLPNGLMVPPGGEIPEGSPASWLLSPDAEADFATGIVALEYEAKSKKFEITWQDPDVQFSGVPTISGGGNRVYGTGAELKTGKTYFYGYRLWSDHEGYAGEQVIRAELGNAPFRKPVIDFKGNKIFRRSDYRIKRGEFYDAGNNLIILEDGSLIISGGRGLARVRNRRNNLDNSKK
ncbi:MAG: hypothetical protein AAGA18_13170 [Verrucomicrobiota bacterium]